MLIDLQRAMLGACYGDAGAFAQVGLDLSFGFHHEAQAPAVPAQAGEGAERVAAGVPQRIEQAGPAVQLAQAIRAGVGP